MKVSINGHHLNREQLGPQDGSAVVLLHHGLGSVRAWKGQVPALLEAGYRVLAYDRWGYGGSDARPRLDVPGFATDLEDLEALLESWGVQQAALIGHSDGGTIALAYAARHPSLVTCLVTVAAHIYYEPQMEPGIRGIREAFEHEEAFRTGMRLVHGEKYQEVFSNWYNGWYKSDSLSWDMRPVLGKITCPTLVVQGEMDEHATPQHAMDIAETIYGAELWLLPGARHMLPQENAPEFNHRILQFLQDHVPVRQSL